MRKYEGRIHEVVDLNMTTRQMRIGLTEPVDIEFLAGQWVHVHLPQESSKIPRLRAYFIASEPENPYEITLMVQKYETDPAIPHIGERQAGDEVVFWGPFGSFVLDEVLAPNYLFLASGIGIVPFLAFLRQMEKLKEPPKSLLFWEVPSNRDILFEDELKAFTEKLPFHYKITVHHATSDWDGSTGNVVRVAKKRVQHFEGLMAYICGGKEMVAASVEWLIGAGVSPDYIRREFLF